MIRAVARLPLWWVLMHLGAPPPADPPVWRLYSSDLVHVGLRPAASWGEGFGATLQVTVRTPW